MFDKVLNTPLIVLVPSDHANFQENNGDVVIIVIIVRSNYCSHKKGLDEEHWS